MARSEKWIANLSVNDKARIQNSFPFLRPVLPPRPATPMAATALRQSLANNYTEHFNWQKSCTVKLNILTFHHVDFEY